MTKVKLHGQTHAEGFYQKLGYRNGIRCLYGGWNSAYSNDESVLMRKLSKQHFVIYGVGILILTLGIALTIQSQLGTSPFDALLVGLAETVGLTVGSWEIIIAMILIVVNSLLVCGDRSFLD